MLDGSENGQLFSEWLDFILEPDVKDAFIYLVGVCVCLPRMNCDIQWKGEVRNFRLFDEQGEQPYSFITNQKWVLFYFRPVAVRALRDCREELMSTFDEFKENPAGEWTVKLRNIEEVKRLVAFLGFV